MAKDNRSKRVKKVEKEMSLGKVTLSTTCNRLRELAKLTRVICDYAVFEFNQEGLEVKTVDATKTQSGHIILSSDGMDDYSCKPTEVKFGMNFEILSKFLDTVKPKSSVQCVFDGERLEAILKADNLSKKIELKDNFKDWTEWRRQEVNIDYPNVFKEISTKDLKIAIKGVQDVDDEEVFFESNKATFIVKAIVEGDEIDIPFIDQSGDNELAKHDKKSKTFVKSKFPVSQINKIVKVTKDKATISMGDNLPVEFSWYPEENMCAVFMVAPRVKG